MDRPQITSEMLMESIKKAAAMTNNPELTKLLRVHNEKIGKYGEIKKLHQLLKNEGIGHVFKPFMDGNQIAIHYTDPEGTYHFISIIEHSGSFGHEDNLVELLDSINYDFGVMPEGYLTAEIALSKIKLILNK